MFSVRDARYDDCSWFYALSQSEDVRKNSVRSESFDYTQHAKWWDMRFSDPNTVMYVAEIDSRPCGHVRYGKADEECCELAISICPDYRGHGYATELLLATEALAYERLATRTAVALVLPRNTASIKAFTRAQYEFQWVTERRGKQVYRYEKCIAPPEVEIGDVWFRGMVW